MTRLTDWYTKKGHIVNFLSNKNKIDIILLFNIGNDVTIFR